MARWIDLPAWIRLALSLSTQGSLPPSCTPCLAVWNGAVYGPQILEPWSTSFSSPTHSSALDDRKPWGSLPHITHQGLLTVFQNKHVSFNFSPSPTEVQTLNATFFSQGSRVRLAMARGQPPKTIYSRGLSPLANLDPLQDHHPSEGTVGKRTGQV